MKKIKNILLILILSLAFISCSDKKTKCYVCDRSENSQVVEFLSNNIKSSNNMSGKEMEGVISELRKTGIKLYCRQIFVKCAWRGDVIWEEVQKDSLETLHPYL